MLRQYILLQEMIRARRDERGATAVEYGLMVVLIAAVIVGIVYLIGQNVLQGFTTVNTELDKVP
jgi:pilus assembly protein Flp/PilA